MEYVIGAFWIGLELFCCLLFNGAFLSKKELHRKCIYKILLIRYEKMCDFMEKSTRC